MTDNADHDTVHHISLWFSEGEPPADWLRAFEAYGHAMAAASAFEMLMSLLIVKAEVLRLGKRKDSRTTPDENRRLMENVQRRTYDRLMRDCWKTFDLTERLRIGMEDGKNVRDYLAHNFWQAHIHSLWSDAGVDVIAEHCAWAAHHFKLCGELLSQEAGVSAQDFIEMSKEHGDHAAKVAGWAELLHQVGWNEVAKAAP